MTALRTVFVSFVFLAGLAGSAAAQLLPIVEKARSYLGTESALGRIESVRFEGRLISTETQPDGATKTAEADVEIICQKPFQQRIVAEGDGKREVTALDGYEAWQRVEDPRLPGGWRLNLLGKEQVKRLRANTWENLAFFRPVEQHTGRVEDRGLVELDGQRAHVLAFVHSEGIVFTRYFDPATGRLLLTETEQGARIREEGEITAGGVRFPRRITTEMTLPGGTQRRVVINVDSVTVNEVFAADTFRVPLPGERVSR